MDAPVTLEPGLNLVEITLCDLCLDGAGGGCHTPACALWLNRAPDISIRDSPFIESIKPIDFSAQTI